MNSPYRVTLYVFKSIDPIVGVLTVSFRVAVLFTLAHCHGLLGNSSTKPLLMLLVTYVLIPPL